MLAGDGTEERETLILDKNREGFASPSNIKIAGAKDTNQPG